MNETLAGTAVDTGGMKLDPGVKVPEEAKGLAVAFQFFKEISQGDVTVAMQLLSLYLAHR